MNVTELFLALEFAPDVEVVVARLPKLINSVAAVSFRHWLTGETGIVEIGSQWTARRREQMGMPLRETIKDDKPKAQS